MGLFIMAVVEVHRPDLRLDQSGGIPERQARCMEEDGNSEGGWLRVDGQEAGG